MPVQWQSSKAYELMRHHKENYPAYLKKKTCSISLEKATVFTSAMYQIIKDEDDCKLEWPKPDKHKQASRHYTYGLVLGVGETEESFRQRRDSKQNRKADDEAGWLRCAIITSRVLKYLATEHAKLFPTERAPPSKGIDQNQASWFDPAEFYNYMWICLNEGKLTYALYREQALGPSDQDPLSPWYALMAREISGRVLRSWQTGIILAVCILPFRSREVTHPCSSDQLPEGVPVPLPQLWVVEISNGRKDITTFLTSLRQNRR